MAKTQELSYEQIKRSIVNRQYAPVYLFHGEESFFIDELSHLLLDTVVEAEQKDFNQYVFYGMESDVHTIISTCQRFPMMAEKQLVVVREAQSLKEIELIATYLKRPSPATVLVLNYKHGKIDGRTSLAAAIKEVGIQFESKKIYENEVPGYISQYLQQRQYAIDPKAAQMIAEFVGTDLTKVFGELDKLLIALSGRPDKRISAQLVEDNIGISKEYNSFEFQKALAGKQVLKANRIALSYSKNPKQYPLVKTLAFLYGFFSNLMICHFEKDKSDRNLMAVLNFKFGIQLVDYKLALANYGAIKTMDCISLLREYDAKLKGVGNASVNEGELLKELIFKLMH